MLTKDQLITKYANANIGRSSQTNIRMKCFAVQQLITYLNKPISEITTKDINRWIGFLFSKGYAKKSIQKKLTSIRMFFDWCSDNHVISDNPNNDILPFKAIIKKCINERGEYIEGGYSGSSEPGI